MSEVIINGTKIHYIESGRGDPVIMLHGFPTSSFLYRNILPIVGQTHRAIAFDLPGYGASDKSLESSYSFNYYLEIIQGFISELDLVDVHLVVHDIGGSIGLLWALRNQDRVSSCTFLNTLIYPSFSWGVILFMMMLRFPPTRNWLVSASGIRWTMQFGTASKLNPTELMEYLLPFQKKVNRKVLVKTVSNLSIKAFKEIEMELGNCTFPVQAVYGSRDKILPHVAGTMARLEKDMPHLKVTALDHCGHFLQEDDPQTVGNLILEFLNSIDRNSEMRNTQRSYSN